MFLLDECIQVIEIEEKGMGSIASLSNTNAHIKKCKWILRASSGFFIALNITQAEVKLKINNKLLLIIKLI